jgi:hypothetical protein
MHIKSVFLGGLCAAVLFVLVGAGVEQPAELTQYYLLDAFHPNNKNELAEQMNIEVLATKTIEKGCQPIGGVQVYTHEFWGEYASQAFMCPAGAFE